VVPQGAGVRGLDKRNYSRLLFADWSRKEENGNDVAEGTGERRS